MKNNKYGFSVVGLLITLVVMCVIFVVAMPSLKTSLKTDSKTPQEQPLETVDQVSNKALLDKASAELNQAFARLQIETNCMDLKCTGLLSEATNNKTFGDTISKYINVMKNCGTTANLGCFATDVISPKNGADKRFNYDGTEGYYRIITNQGVSFLINNNANNCSGKNTSAPSKPATCGYIYVDVNGLKSPNTIGLDIYYFDIIDSNGDVIQLKND